MAGDRSVGRDRSARTLAVIIATRDRPLALRTTLEALLATRPAAGWRLALRVVDNGETASAAATIAEAAAAASGRAPHVTIAGRREPVAGLARARNRALAPDLPEAEAIAIIDDDVIVPPDYPARAAALLEARPEAGVIGGMVTLHDPLDRPMTILTRPERAMFTRHEDVLAFVIGCNLLIRPAVFREIGLFDQRLGAGTPAKAAEDSDFVWRAWRAGFYVFYEPDLVVAHAHGRRTPEDVGRLMQGYSTGAGALYAKHVLFGLDLRMLGQMVRKLRRDRAAGRKMRRYWPAIRRGMLVHLRQRLGLA